MPPWRQMSKAVDNLQDAQYLAETLRRAGVTRNLWFLPACQSLYIQRTDPLQPRERHSSAVRSMFPHSTRGCKELLKAAISCGLTPFDAVSVDTRGFGCGPSPG
jgi:uncharacterized protein YbcV (DUF1398 family)